MDLLVELHVECKLEKKKVQVFNHGKPRDCIKGREAIKEIWEQNDVEKAVDGICMVQMSMKGDGLVLFESAVNDEMSPNDKEAGGHDLTNKIIAKDLEAVVTDIFPCCALSMSEEMDGKGDEEASCFVCEANNCRNHKNEQCIAVVPWSNTSIQVQQCQTFGAHGVHASKRIPCGI